MRINGLTPREIAHDLAMGWLTAVYRGHTGDLANMTPSETQAVKAAIARLHAQLLNKSGLDGLLLGD